MVKSPHSDAGDVGSILDPETKIQHTPEQLSPSAPCSAARENLTSTMKTQHSQNNNNKKK